MNELKEMTANKANYYALLIAIIKRKSAKLAMIEMGICPIEEGVKNNEI